MERSESPESPSQRILTTLNEARAARRSGRPEEALTLLAGAQGLMAQGPVRREVRVALQRARGLCYLALERPAQARQALALGLEQAGPEAALADPVRAELATTDLMADEPRRAAAQLEERGRDRRATLLAQARLILWQGDAALAEKTLQACEQSPGGSSDLAPPSTALRCLGALWDGRPEQARLLMEGVAVADNPWWGLVRLLVLRSLWVSSGDARYLQLALGVAEQLRFETPRQLVPGLRAAAAAQHALVLSLTGNNFLALQAAEEALAGLGPLTLPEWPRAAVLHDLAVVFREAGRPEAWQAVLDAWAEAPTASWRQRLRLVTGPRADGATEQPTQDAGRLATSLLTEVALRITEDRRGPEQAFVRGLAEELALSGACWLDPQGRMLAHSGAAVASVDEAEVQRVVLPQGGAVLLVGASPAVADALDPQTLGRLAFLALRWARDHQREARLRDAVEVAEARAEAASQALERARRGAMAEVAGGRFPTVAGRSAALRATLDRMALLGGTQLPVLLQGRPGTGRRHLARALAAQVGGRPEQCPVLDCGLVPAETMTSTLVRLESEAAGGPYVVANAELLTPEAATWLVARAADPARRGRPLVTLDGDAEGKVAATLRRALAAGSVAVPTLGERLEDLPDLIDALAESLGRRPEAVGTAARALLVRRLWVGEVAGLRNALADAVVRSAGKTLLPEHFEAAAGADQGASLSEGLDLGYHDAVRSFRQQLLVHALETTGGNRTRAAELLGVQRTYFMRLIRDLEDAPPAP